MNSWHANRTVIGLQMKVNLYPYQEHWAASVFAVEPEAAYNLSL